MPTFVSGGSDIMDVVAGGFLDQRTTQWLGERAQQVRTHVTHAGQQFFDQARTMYDVVSNSQAMQMLRNLREKTGGVWNADQIQPLTTLESIQTAAPVMQRWIMAEPTIRERYLNGEMEGYSDTYTNPHGDCIADRHIDWRMVMSGSVDVPEDDSPWVSREYIEYQGGEHPIKPLAVHERQDIRTTWARVVALTEEGGEDPTSVYGNLL